MMLHVTFSIIIFLICFSLLCYCLYIEYYDEFANKHKMEQEIIHRFQGDKQKIKFYKGFKMYFDGTLSEEGLKKWLLSHQI